MKLTLKRIVIFTENIQSLELFYQNVIGLVVIGKQTGWVEFDAGGCSVALHHGKPVIGRRPPKFVFFAADVAAARTAVMKRGAVPMTEVQSTANFDMSDGKDPDGNPFQISSR
jgi:hypothetical protein